ncbi:MAG TPA: hypothetical protein VD928_03410 [Candidatus Paceibacterota bacterium]|nr:hypothetical protein [Candidatus Paceibacterota bacterium]
MKVRMIVGACAMFALGIVFEHSASENVSLSDMGSSLVPKFISEAIAGGNYNKDGHKKGHGHKDGKKNHSRKGNPPDKGGCQGDKNCVTWKIEPPKKIVLKKRKPEMCPATETVYKTKKVYVQATPPRDLQCPSNILPAGVTVWKMGKHLCVRSGGEEICQYFPNLR